jgi:hypothetical protein
MREIVTESAEATGILRPHVCVEGIMSEINYMGKFFIYISLHKNKSTMSQVDDKVRGACLKTLCSLAVCLT